MVRLSGLLSTRVLDSYFLGDELGDYSLRKAVPLSMATKTTRPAIAFLKKPSWLRC